MSAPRDNTESKESRRAASTDVTSSPHHNEEQLEPSYILERERLAEQLLRECQWYRDAVGRRLDVGKVADFILAERQASFTAGQEDCRLAGDPTNHAHFPQATRTAVIEGRIAEATWWAEKLQQYHGYTGGGMNPYAAEINGRISEINKLSTEAGE